MCVRLEEGQRRRRKERRGELAIRRCVAPVAPDPHARCYGNPHWPRQLRSEPRRLAQRARGMVASLGGMQAARKACLVLPGLSRRSDFGSAGRQRRLRLAARGDRWHVLPVPAAGVRWSSDARRLLSRASCAECLTSTHGCMLIDVPTARGSDEGGRSSCSRPTTSMSRAASSSSSASFNCCTLPHNADRKWM